jgi:DNA topoisomerase-1
VKWEKINATLPKDSDPDVVTLEAAVQLIDEKAAKKGKTRRKTAAKKTSSTKTAAKKKSAVGKDA